MQPERRPSGELEPEIIHAYASTFLGRKDVYSLQTKNGSYVAIYKSLPERLMLAHLNGKVTLGTYALDEDSRAHWICYDADADEAWNRLRTVAVQLADKEVPSYLEQSRRGGHLWLFLPASIPGRQARQFGHHLLNQYDIESVELFPKQDELTTGPGSLVRLPLGFHRKTGRRYHFVHTDGSPIAPTISEQIALLAHPRCVPTEFLFSMIGQVDLAQRSALPVPTGRGAGETLSERIKDRITAFNFISQYVTLDDRGSGHCPFHDDQHKSFAVNQDQNYWHCFAGCGGGSVIDFWSRWREKEGLDSSFTATIKDLAEMLF